MESINLETLSLQVPAQTLLQRLSITASRTMMEHFYDYSLLTILHRLRGLAFLRFIFHADEFGNGLRFYETDGYGPASNGLRFMNIVDCHLTHVGEVTVEENSLTKNYITAYDVALLEVMDMLADRNRFWQRPVRSRRIRTFWGGYMGEDGGFCDPFGLALGM